MTSVGATTSRLQRNPKDQKRHSNDNIQTLISIFEYTNISAFSSSSIDSSCFWTLAFLHNVLLTVRCNLFSSETNPSLGRPQDPLEKHPLGRCKTIAIIVRYHSTNLAIYQVRYLHSSVLFLQHLSPPTLTPQFDQ